MSANNSTTLVGNLTRDPELKILNNGTALVKFSLAVNHRWKNNQTDEWDEKTSFFDCIAWGRLADNIAESLTKGKSAIVMGRLDLQQWEDDDGKKRSRVEVVVEAAGPNLMWATASVEDNPRDGGGNAGGGRSSGSGRTRAGRTTARQAPVEPTYSDDEEPF